eukprot:TRINITY_DN8452_c1_g1_i2.p1 TRINITY_DN8452_c1_g1~~TRINITY_DN8452_c1_g1_i2.p1  ORF type:complete len:288 (-),score=76.11 TRINITY_DN8452_c1_g1_i2:202-1065(-)
MGDTLSSPNTEKETSRDENERIRYGASAMQGWRRGMEDAHTTILNLPKVKGNAFFAVYDGHCGAPVAEFCGKNMQVHLEKNANYLKGEYTQALHETFLLMDELLKDDEDMKHTRAGCTAVATLITKDKIYTSNAGDSRAILITPDQKVVELSHDHKPFNEQERERIEAAGGFVMLGRVNGNLALSRAIGDFDFKNAQGVDPKEQAVTADPEVTVEDIRPGTQHLVIACDGIWDVKSNEDVAKFVHEGLKKTDDLGEICEELMTDCLAAEPGGLGCDNMSVIILELKG